MRTSSRVLVALGVVAFMGVGAGAAQAQSSISLAAQNTEFFDLWNDDSWEAIYRGGEVITDPTERLQVDDVIRGMFRIDEVNDVAPSPDTFGVFSQRVVDVIAAEDHGGIFDNGTQLFSPSDDIYILGPEDLGDYQTFLDAAHDGAGIARRTVAEEGTMISFYEGDLPDGSQNEDGGPPDSTAPVDVENSAVPEFVSESWIMDVGFADPDNASQYDEDANQIVNPGTGEGWVSWLDQGDTPEDAEAVFTASILDSAFPEELILPISLESASGLVLNSSDLARLGVGGGQFADLVGQLSLGTPGQEWPLTNDVDFNTNIIPTPTAGLAGLLAFGMMGMGYRRPTGKKAEEATA